MKKIIIHYIAKLNFQNNFKGKLFHQFYFGNVEN